MHEKLAHQALLLSRNSLWPKTFHQGCLFSTPGTVKLFESSTGGGGLPNRIKTAGAGLNS
jgi:hypothetical protein